MKFSWKLFSCTIIVIASALGVIGYYLVSSTFNMALHREAKQAFDESSILCFAFETATLSVPTKYEQLQNSTIEQIGKTLTTSGYTSYHIMRVSDEEKSPLFSTESFLADDNLLFQTKEGMRAYIILPIDKKYYLQTVTTFNAVNRTLYLETLKDVSSIFEERSEGFATCSRVTAAMLLFDALIMFILSLWLTKPVKMLSKASRNMARGDYGYRAQIVSNDELGSLTIDFNKMANALEEKMNQLEEEARSREEFVAAFAHELKTPLTSIIGHADLLRSRKMDEEQQFLSAGHIYQEGKRLESLSFKLLDIIVMKNHDISIQPVGVQSIFRYINESFLHGKNVNINIQYDNAIIFAEVSLIKTVLINLIDNAIKASPDGSLISVSGELQDDGYCFSVQDSGYGIPEAEITKITDAFYMVDKSRSRSQNGAGLGLALCVEILELHQSKLHFESVESEGTCVSFILEKV